VTREISEASLRAPRTCRISIAKIVGIRDGAALDVSYLYAASIRQRPARGGPGRARGLALTPYASAA